jgi:hypothetical protein
MYTDYCIHFGDVNPSDRSFTSIQYTAAWSPTEEPEVQAMGHVKMKTKMKKTKIRMVWTGIIADQS